VTITAQFETRIGRSPSAVFAELTALERYPQWLIATGVTGVELLDPGPLAKERGCGSRRRSRAGRRPSRAR
jgi:uncharacterized protein YndB with AHSA1/START domain